jgi:hypothetical protein
VINRGEAYTGLARTFENVKNVHSSYVRFLHYAYHYPEKNKGVLFNNFNERC